MTSIRARVNYWLVQLLTFVASVYLCMFIGGVLANNQAVINLGIQSFFLFLSTFIGSLTLVLLVFVHENGHKLAMEVQKIRSFGPIMILPLGGIMLPGRSMSALEGTITILAGPATGILGIPFLYLGMYQDKPEYVGLALVWILVNAVNLLPVGPLDGTGIVASIISAVSLKAAKLYKKFSVLLLFLPMTFASSTNALVVFALTLSIVILMWLLDNYMTKVFRKYCNKDIAVNPALTGKQALVSAITYGFLTLLLGVSLVQAFSYFL